MHKTKQQSKTQELLKARKDALKLFTGIQHRLETVGEKDGVTFINDSKSTDIESSYYSLELMNQPVVWLMGADYTEENYDVLRKLIQFKVKHIVCFGEAADFAQSQLEPLVDSFSCYKELDKAVPSAVSLCRSGDVLLFSPACPGFDVYDSFSERGDHFQSLLKRQSK